VVHDWGGPIGLRFAVEHPERVARLVVLNTGLYSPSDRWPTPGFLRWRAFAEKLGLDLPVGFVVQSGTLTELTPEVVAAYDAPFPTPESRTGAAMFPLLVPIAEGDPGAAEMRRTRELLGRWDKPALVCFGTPIRCSLRGPRGAMARMIPTAGEPEVLEGAAHFVQEDRGRGGGGPDRPVPGRVLSYSAGGLSSGPSTGTTQNGTWASRSSPSRTSNRYVPKSGTGNP
jgi:haloalkane dehalogenase